VGVRLTGSEAKALNLKVDVITKNLLAKDAPAIQDGHLVIGTTVADGNGALVDELSSLLGDARVGIFNGDVRVATSARKPDDTRAVGPKLDPAPREAIYSRGQRYTGQINVGGIPLLPGDSVRSGSAPRDQV
jgi:Single cache domain 3